ncbi:hypothetical protein [Natronincola ferrireducens]|uniref:Uncharacterized protein n=1 Tax=Natronincola ferrireducens TaxID=393762 RepID=A0A1G8X0S9_9FIRM|nr:hypothetical protein [Natronincola ferrireducens]SDJ84249.1 hypothetical protein SAMN05660472_00087 [Natronincola ferrireducens]
MTLTKKKLSGAMGTVQLAHVSQWARGTVPYGVCILLIVALLLQIFPYTSFAQQNQTYREIEGFIEAIDSHNQQLVMVDFRDRQHILNIGPSPVVQINGKTVALRELPYGLEVSAILLNGVVTRIQGFLEEEPFLHGYIPPGSRTKVGDVLFIDKDTVEIKTNEGREKYQITGGTRILRNNGSANLFEVKVGDRVLLSFNDIYSPHIATIRVEDQERHVQGIYRGRIEKVDPRNREIILKDITTYENGRWLQHPKSQVKLRAEGDLLYEGGQKISLRDLTSRNNQEVYAAVENSYGLPKIAKLLLKNGFTTLYEGNITDIQYGTGRMVADNVGFTFHPGTILVKNNRLVDTLNLDLGQNVYIAADLLRGSRNTSFVSIEYSGMLEERIDGSRLVIYRGTIQDIHQNRVTIGRLARRLDYLRLEGNQWIEDWGKRTFTLTEDTFIFDSDLQKEIPSQYFTDTRFIDPEDIEDDELRERIEEEFYLEKGAYFIVREITIEGETYEEILALNLTPITTYEGGSLHIEHSSIGEIAAVDMDADTITLTNIKHWNTLNSRWEIVRGSETIHTEKAVVLINDTPINREEMYKLRKNAKAYMIKSKQVSTGDDAYVIIVEQ